MALRTPMVAALALLVTLPAASASAFERRPAAPRVVAAALLAQAAPDSGSVEVTPRGGELRTRGEQRTAPPAATDPLEGIRAAQRSRRAAVAMTAVVPGWGQLYADTPFWGAVGFGVQMFYLGNIVMERRRVEREKVARDLETDPDRRELRTLLVAEHRERARDFSWWAGGAFLVLALDAWVSVELADFDDPGVPTPDLDAPWALGAADGVQPLLALDLRF